MTLYDDGYAPAEAGGGRAARIVNIGAAAVSLGLIAGIGVWGYTLIKRDVTGIPVVRAMEGAMRVAPDNPGGAIAAHTGLAVNAVAAEGAAAPPEDRLVLAPKGDDLAREDLDVQPMAEAEEVRPAPDAAVEIAVNAAIDAQEAAAVPAAGAEARLETDDILALADRIAAGAAPLSALAEGEVVQPVVKLAGAPVKSAGPRIDPARAWVKTSLRPQTRPAALANAAAIVPAVVTATPAPEARISRAALPAGTKLVQLGAFPTAEAAADTWGRLGGRFAAYLTGKDMLIQEATSGGRTFYRLRAKGFADLADARRFCAALEAGNADCIPVVVR